MGGLLELLRPKPWRGDVIAAGALPLAVGVVLANLRMAQWAVGYKFVLLAVVAALLLTMGLLAPMEGEAPRPYQSVLFVTGLILLTFAIGRLADVLGAEHGLSDGKAFWVLGVGALAAAAVSAVRNSAVCALLAALQAGVSVLAGVSLAFDPGIQTFRWVLLAMAVVFAAMSLTLRDRRRRHAVQLVNAAGLAILTLGVTLGVAQLFVPFSNGLSLGNGGWKAVLFVAGAALVAVAGTDREPGPAYVGAAVLVTFVFTTAFSGSVERTPGGFELHGPSLWFWPAFLLAVGVIALVVGLRPSRPLPPEPGPAREPPPPAPLPRR